MELRDLAGIVVGHLLSVAGVICGVILFSRLRAGHHPPSATFAWLLAIIFVPYVGVPLFLVFGGRKLRRLVRAKGPLSLKANRSVDNIEGVGEAAQIPLLVGKPPPFSGGNAVDLLPDAVDNYRRLMEMIDGAKETIHITTFILTRDEVAKAIVDALARKATEGVKVRLLLDGLGSFNALGSFLAPLRDAGGQVGTFLPVLRLRWKWSAHLRNHRKVVIVDGREAMVGGRNIGAEYIAPAPHPGLWRDFAIVVRGPVVASLQEIFASDWEFATEEDAEGIMAESLPTAPERSGNVTIQTVASGPDIEADAFHETVLGAMFQARRRVWIVTPYFIPDAMILRTLTTLAQIGRDVRVVVPAKSDKVMVDLARRYYLRELCRAGATVYLHRGPQLHTKLLLIDGELAAVGSPNMDMRSLYLNYELALFVYSSEETRGIEAHVGELIEQADIYDPRERRAPGMVTRALENFGYLVSPLL